MYLVLVTSIMATLIDGKHQFQLYRVLMVVVGKQVIGIKSLMIIRLKAQHRTQGGRGRPETE